MYECTVVIQPFRMPKRSCRTLATGARQFVVHEAFEMMWCVFGSYLSSLTPRTTVKSGFLAGAVMITFFAPGGQVLRGAVAIGEEPGRLEHDVDAEVLPWQLRRVLHRQHLELVLVDRDLVAARADVRLQVAEDRVVLEQVRERRGVRQVVDRDEVESLRRRAPRA